MKNAGRMCRLRLSRQMIKQGLQFLLAFAGEPLKRNAHAKAGMTAYGAARYIQIEVSGLDGQRDTLPTGSGEEIQT